LEVGEGVDAEAEAEVFLPDPFPMQRETSTTGRNRRAPHLEISYKVDNSLHMKLPAFPGMGKKCDVCDCCERVIASVPGLSTLYLVLV
jgi:hypothetical protein